MAGAPRVAPRSEGRLVGRLGIGPKKTPGVGPGPAFGLGLEGGEGVGPPFPTAPEPTAQQRMRHEAAGLS